MEDASGQIAVAYLTDMVKASEPAPVDYCRDQIEDILLSLRKRELTDRLEQEIVDDAKNKNHFVIY